MASATAGWRRLIGRNLQSVKVMACPKSESSAAARQFWDKNYNVVKHLNPTFPFMIRAVPEVEPYMMVEYDWNYKAKVPLSGLDVAGIEKKIEQAVEIGNEMPRSAHQSLKPHILPSVVE